VSDLRFGGGAASPVEVTILDSVLPVGSARDQLLPALHALNDTVGWISRPALDEIGRRTGVAPAVGYGVASFYAMFSTQPRPPRVAYICDDVPCRLAGAAAIIEQVENGWAERVDRDGLTWERSPCLGLCDHAPAALVDRAARPRFSPGDLRAPAPPGPPPPTTGVIGEPRLLARIGAGVDPEDVSAFRAAGGLAGLRRAAELGPEATIAEVKASGLIGRGGAAFPAAIKWEAVARHPVRPHYLVINADESETGTFKDRVLLEGDPYAVLEGAAIAAFACGVERVFIYLRGEYPHAEQRILAALAELGRRQWFGLPMVAGFEVRRGAGAYICGEETALFNSIEGNRGEPRSKPPFPVNSGLFGKPTVINNVETIANIPLILAEGGAAYRRVGTEQSPGTKLFAVCGHVARPGVYEVPFGTTMRALLDLAGGVVGRLQAVQCGGAAGTFLTPSDLDLSLAFESLRVRGATVGSGAVVVINETVDLMEVVKRGAEFFAHESCGQCVPCRVGTQRQVELLERRAAGEDVDPLLAEVAQVMRDASICGLGQTAASMVQSALKEFSW